jgi:hypothetical protein
MAASTLLLALVENWIVANLLSGPSMAVDPLAPVQVSTARLEHLAAEWRLVLQRIQVIVAEGIRGIA